MTPNTSIRNSTSWTEGENFDPGILGGRKNDKGKKDRRGSGGRDMGHPLFRFIPLVQKKFLLLLCYPTLGIKADTEVNTCVSPFFWPETTNSLCWWLGVASLLTTNLQFTCKLLRIHLIHLSLVFTVLITFCCLQPGNPICSLPNLSNIILLNPPRSTSTFLLPHFCN